MRIVIVRHDVPPPVLCPSLKQAISGLTSSAR